MTRRKRNGRKRSSQSYREFIPAYDEIGRTRRSYIAIDRILEESKRRERERQRFVSKLRRNRVPALQQFIIKNRFIPTRKAVKNTLSHMLHARGVGELAALKRTVCKKNKDARRHAYFRSVGRGGPIRSVKRRRHDC